MKIIRIAQNSNIIYDRMSNYYHNIYMKGECIYLAIAMGKLFGWDIGVDFDESKDWINHAWAITPNGKHVDITGVIESPRLSKRMNVREFIKFLEDREGKPVDKDKMSVAVRTIRDIFDKNNYVFNYLHGINPSEYAE